jgi:leader peptidase (prepilin peptidase)/N-methyltransferase
VTGELTDPVVVATLAVVAGLVGLLVGSFLNVVVARVPEGLSVVTPRSACPACGTPIPPSQNVPVVSWLLLRGRAACCGEPISRQYPLVELVTAAAFAAVTAWQGFSWFLPALLYLAAISVALTVIDLKLLRLPNQIVLPSYVVVAALLGVAAVGEGEYWPLVRAGLASLVLWGFYFALHLIKPKGMGYGDVKLAGVLGMYFGWLGWGVVAVGTFLGFAVGGVVGIALMAAGRAGRKTQIPFGPYMIVGAWLGLTVGGAVWDWYLRTSGYR